MLDAELLCGFDNWLFGHLLDSMRERAIPTKHRHGWPSEVAETLREVCQRSTEVVAPFCRKGATTVGGLTLRPDANEPALYAHRATAFSLRCAIMELQSEDRRWAQGKTDTELAKDARGKRALLVALTEEAFGGLAQVAASLASDDALQFSRSIEVAEVICEAILAVLWSINECEDLDEGGLDSVIAALDEEVDSAAVQAAGRCAEQVMHRIWIRLHDEICDIEGCRANPHA